MGGTEGIMENRAQARLCGNQKLPCRLPEEMGLGFAHRGSPTHGERALCNLQPQVLPRQMAASVDSLAQSY